MFALSPNHNTYIICFTLFNNEYDDIEVNDLIPCSDDVNCKHLNLVKMVTLINKSFQIIIERARSQANQLINMNNMNDKYD